MIGVLTKKINEADFSSKNTEKDFLKNGKDPKTFINEYLKKRMDFHKYSIFKVKVNQS